MGSKKQALQNRQFETALPRLLGAYDRGRLVPFLGAGASVPACPLWPEFVENLETLAGLRPKSVKSKSPVTQSSQHLIRRAAHAVRRLKNEGDVTFVEVIKGAIQSKKTKTSCPFDIHAPPVSSALAGIWWPLVLTTNYDDWFYA